MFKSQNKSKGQTDFMEEVYCNDPKFSDRQVLTNSADPGQGLHCFPFCLHFLDASLYSKATLFKF